MDDATAISRYLQSIERDLGSGIATEHTHRPALKGLIEAIGDAGATNEPKRISCGAPDLSVWQQTTHGPLNLGYIEAKDVGVPLAALEGAEQIERYLAALPNLILTDYLDFRWYVDGSCRRIASIGVPTAGGLIQRHQDGAEQVLNLLRDFLGHESVGVRTTQELAQRMARLTRLIRDIIVRSFEQELATEAITDLQKAFEEVLIPNLTVSGLRRHVRPDDRLWTLRGSRKPHR